MSGSLLLAHGDDSFGLDQVLLSFATSIGADDRIEILPERSPDEAAIDRARLESGSVGLFGVRLAVLRQPLRAAGRSTAASERLMALVDELPDGAALALVDVRSTRTPPDHRPAGQAGGGGESTGGDVVERIAPRRGELQAWIRRHATAMELVIEPRAAAVLAERVGGAVAESDVERGEQTRIADGELKLGTYAPGRPITARTSRPWWPTRGRPACSPSPTPSIGADAQPPRPPSTGRWPRASRCCASWAPCRAGCRT